MIDPIATNTVRVAPATRSTVDEPSATSFGDALAQARHDAITIDDASNPRSGASPDTTANSAKAIAAGHGDVTAHSDTAPVTDAEREVEPAGDDVAAMSPIAQPVDPAFATPPTPAPPVTESVATRTPTTGLATPAATAPVADTVVAVETASTQPEAVDVPALRAPSARPAEPPLEPAATSLPGLTVDNVEVTKTHAPPVPTPAAASPATDAVAGAATSDEVAVASTPPGQPDASNTGTNTGTNTTATDDRPTPTPTPEEAAVPAAPTAESADESATTDGVDGQLVPHAAPATGTNASAGDAGDVAQVAPSRLIDLAERAQRESQIRNAEQATRLGMDVTTESLGTIRIEATNNTGLHLNLSADRQYTRQLLIEQAAVLRDELGGAQVSIDLGHHDRPAADSRRSHITEGRSSTPRPAPTMHEAVRAPALARLVDRDGVDLRL
jgi:hypothetical protein